MQPAIELSEIRKSYRLGRTELEVLHGVDLAVEPGEYVAIVGPSGSGKSTLMHIVGCLDRPTHGRYRLEGMDVSELSDRELSHIRSTRIGFVFQSFNLISQLNVLENVEVPFVYADVPAAEGRRRAQEALVRVGLAHRLRHRSNELSGGERQRVAIARALAIAPALILADEPTGNLDSTSGREIMAFFETLHEEGATILMVTHDRNVARRALRIVEFRDGLIERDYACGDEPGQEG
jgi:putative ABC transport system ATP-binding protein